MCDEPLIFVGCAVKRPKSKPARSKATIFPAATPSLEATEQKGDLLIRDLWHYGTDSVHNMRVVNTYYKSHLAKTPEKCLQEAERAKKKMYLEACLQQHRHFFLFVAYVDGLLGVEERATLNRINSRLGTKWRKPYSRACRYIKSRVATTLVQATHRCIQGFGAE